MEKLLLRPMEAANIIGVGRTRMYEMIASGEIPAIHLGRSIRIPTNKLRQWVEDKQQETRS